MDYVLPLLPFLAIIVVAAILWFATHKATETKIVSVVQAEVAKLKAHFEANPTVQKVEAAVAPDLKALVAGVDAKIDAIRDVLGGALTDVEKSAAAQAFEARIKQGEDALAALASGLHDAQALKAALAGPPPAAAAPAAAKPETAAPV